MELNNIKEVLRNYHKGQFIRMGWQTRIESAKARKAGVEVLKISEATVRLGIKYGNIHAVQVMRANATGESKPYRVWFKHMDDFPVVVQHLEDEAKKYLQVFTAKNAAPRVRYFINGVPMSRAEVEASGYCNPSAFASKEDSLMYQIPLENIRFIGKEVV